jgi:hypothetical protein
MDKFIKFKKTYVSRMYQHETTANKEISYTQAFSTKTAHTVMRRILTFQSMMDHMNDGGPIRL